MDKIELLKSYKELLDNGVITEEEFETKKKEILEASEGSLLARAIQHEFDHLDGILFVDHCRNRFEADKILTDKGLPPTDPNYLLEEKELEEEIQKLPPQEEKKVD